jgi:hypothetical protein
MIDGHARDGSIGGTIHGLEIDALTKSVWRQGPANSLAQTRNF